MLERFQVKRVLVPHVHPESRGGAAILEAIRDQLVDGHPIPLVDLEKERRPPLDWGVSTRLLYADRWSPEVAGSSRRPDENNASVVIRLVHDQVAMLFMGDAQGKGRRDPPEVSKLVEGYLLRNIPADQLRATVLKVGFHGSESASTLPFLEAVRPDIVVIMSGRRPYGSIYLPDESTVQRLTALPWRPQLLRTDHDDEREGRTRATDRDHDDIFIETDGKQVRVYQARGGAGGEAMDVHRQCRSGEGDRRGQSGEVIVLQLRGRRPSPRTRPEHVT